MLSLWLHYGKFKRGIMSTKTKTTKLKGLNPFGYLAGLLFFAGTQVALFSYSSYKQFPLTSRIVFDLFFLAVLSVAVYIVKESDKIS